MSDAFLKIRSDAGFTLLELLISMTLLGLLSLVLLGGLHFGTRVWEASEIQTTDMNRMRAFRSDLARAIERAYPEIVGRNASERHADFDGTRSTLAFLTEANVGSGQMSRVAIELKGAPGGAVLDETSRPELAADNVKTADKHLADIASLDFAYFGADKPDESPSWRSEWRGKSTLPALVRIRVQFAKSGFRWPDLVVAPKIAADVSCSFDAMTRRCEGR